jgi:hypothetical protein
VQDELQSAESTLKAQQAHAKKQATEAEKRRAKAIDPKNNTPWKPSDTIKHRAVNSEGEEGGTPGVMAVLKFWSDGSSAKCVELLLDVIKKLDLE